MAALPAGSPLQKLLDAPMQPGVVEWIGLRPQRHARLVEVEDAALDPVEGLIGDHYRSRTAGGRRVTLVGAEDLLAIAAGMGREAVTPGAGRSRLTAK